MFTKNIITNLSKISNLFIINRDKNHPILLKQRSCHH